MAKQDLRSIGRLIDGLKHHADGTFIEMTASSGVERRPPGFGEGKSKRLRIIEWYSRDPGESKPQRYSAVLCTGMPVPETLQAAYWDAREISARVIDKYRKVGMPPFYLYCLFNTDGEIVGCGEFDGNDDADDMAFISCTLMEKGLRIAVPISPDAIAAVVGATNLGGRQANEGAA